MARAPQQASEVCRFDHRLGMRNRFQEGLNLTNFNILPVISQAVTTLSSKRLSYNITNEGRIVYRSFKIIV